MSQSASSNRLRRAIRDNDLLWTKRLVHKVDSVENYDAEEEGMSSLHLAALLGHQHIVAFLVQIGHDRREISRNGRLETPIMLAAKHDREQTVHFLALQFPRSVDMRNYRQQTPLIVASRAGNDAVCNILLDFGARVDAAEMNGDTALHHASAWGHLQVLRSLLLRGAAFDKENRAGFTAAAYSYTSTCNTYFVSMVADVEKQRLKTRPMNRLRSNTGPTEPHAVERRIPNYKPRTNEQ